MFCFFGFQGNVPTGGFADTRQTVLPAVAVYKFSAVPFSEQDKMGENAVIKMGERAQLTAYHDRSGRMTFCSADAL